MTIEEQLKQTILERYKSVRAFTTAIDIPYSTLDSVFKRGISNAGIGTMIKVFKSLDLDVESISDGALRPAQIKIAPSCSDEAMRIATAFDKADSKSKDMVRLALSEYMDAPVSKESSTKLA